MRTLPPAKSAQRWSSYNGYLAALAPRCTRSLRVRYEDFVADPEAGRRALLESVSDVLGGTATTGNTGTVATTPGVAHDLSGNPLRFEAERALRVDDAWRSEMTRRDKTVVTALTAPLLTAFGYGLGC
jgi:hypothetical protein